MTKIIAIGGSNSKTSINLRLARYAASQINNIDSITVDLSKTILPLYGPDLEKDRGIPQEVIEIDELLNSSQGIILSLAEYNGSYSTAFKNMFDWLSRINIKVWKDKPLLLLSTSPGKGGGSHVLKTAKEDFSHFGGNIIADFSLPRFHSNFIENDITDPDLKQGFQLKIDQFKTSL